MKTIRRILLTCAVLVIILITLFAAGVFWPESQLSAVQSSGPIVIDHVTLVDVREGRLKPAQSVMIERGRITFAGDAAALSRPAVATVLDGRAQYLIPALWDMHAHVYAVSPMLDLPLFIAYGVTNVRDMQGCPQPGDPFVACPEDKARWTAEALAGARVGPRIVETTSWMANGPGMVRRLGDVPGYFDTATAADARGFVRHFAGRVDAIKVYDRIPREAYFALVDEAHRLGLDVVGHRPHAVSALEAAAHQKSIEHARFLLHESFPGASELRRSAPAAWREDRRRMVEEHEPEMAQQIFAAMIEHDTWYVPTHLTRWSDAYADDAVVRDDPLLRYLHPLMKRQWLEDLNELLQEDPSPQAREDYRRFYRKGLELTGSAHRAGVQILAGTDYIVAGADLHRELQQLVAAGLSPAAALRAATLSPAEYAGLADRFGTVEPGKVADLILLRADPLRDIRHTLEIEAVVFNGNLYRRADLDRISAHVERRARSWTAGCKMIWRFLKNPAAY